MYIKEISVKNFRSLRDVKISDLSPIVTFFGDNDTGKSNILAFLDIIFKQKYTLEETISGTEAHIEKRASGFYRGEIDNFSDNFYRDGNEPIIFSITICFRRNELVKLSFLPQNFLVTLPKKPQEDLLFIEGTFEKLDAGRASMKLVNARFNNYIFFDSAQVDTAQYLPGYSNLTPAEARGVFDSIMGQLDDAFLMIPATRFLKPEDEMERMQKALLSADTFKNWMFQTSIDRDGERIFRQISDQFNASPFEKGVLSIARVGNNELEILVEDKHALKLPIGRKGSGIQQILVVLSYVTQSRTPIIGIEELEMNLSPRSQTSIISNLIELINSELNPISQVFLTTHSQQIALNKKAERRFVSIEDGETKVSKPSDEEDTGFFRFMY